MIELRTPKPRIHLFVNDEEAAIKPGWVRTNFIWPHPIFSVWITSANTWSWYCSGISVMLKFGRISATSSEKNVNKVYEYVNLPGAQEHGYLCACKTCAQCLRIPWNVGRSPGHDLRSWIELKMIYKNGQLPHISAILLINGQGKQELAAISSRCSYDC